MPCLPCPTCLPQPALLPALPCAEVIKSCRFLGRAEVALADTLSMLSGVPAGAPLWLPLMRRDAGDTVRWGDLGGCTGARAGVTGP